MPRNKICDVRLSVGVPRPLFEALEAEARSRALSVADIARELLIAGVANRIASNAAARQEAA
jgi:hypothetical protein